MLHLRNLCLIQSHRHFLLSSFEEFYNLSFTFGYVIHFESIFTLDATYELKFILEAKIKRSFTELTSDGCWSISRLYSVPLSCFDLHQYHELLIQKFYSRPSLCQLSLLVVLQIRPGFSILNPLHFHLNCLILSSISTKEVCGDFLPRINFGRKNSLRTQPANTLGLSFISTSKVLQYTVCITFTFLFRDSFMTAFFDAIINGPC